MVVFLKWVIVFLICFSFLFEAVLEFLNSREAGKKIPAGLKDLYDQNEYERSLKYEKETSRFGLISGSFRFLVLIIFFFLNGFLKLDEYIRTFQVSEEMVSLLFFGILFFISDILNLPFSIYSNFVIEKKYGFNKMSPGIFIADKIKSYILGVIIGGGLLYLFIIIYKNTGSQFWIYMWIIFSLVGILFSMFYTTWLLPLFNKLTPLPEGKLRKLIEDYCNRAGFKMKDLYIMDGSKRSTKANAFFSGLGRQKKIVLFDTLVNQHTEEEIVAVLAHEIGHSQKRHTRKMMILSLLQMGFMLFLLSWFISNPAFSKVMGAERPVFHFGLIVFILLYSPVSELISILMNWYSRKHEYEADAYAAQTYSGEILSEALKKLSRNNLSNLNPHPCYVFVHYSHPPLYKRLQHINNIKKNDEN